MPDISITFEAWFGLTWEKWHALIRAAETGGFFGAYRSDHFLLDDPPYADALELIVSLVYAAEHTERVRLGSLVAPLSFRDPRHLVRQAAAIDDLSGGRLILGVGSGWNQGEHDMYGYELGDLKRRMDRLEEALAVMTGLLRSDAPLTFDGQFYQLREAVLLPRPRHPGGPRILIGGNGVRRTLPLVARYADIWNGVWLSPEAFHERSQLLDELLIREGRQPGEVKRSLMLLVAVGRNERDLAKSLAWLNRVKPMRRDSLEEILSGVEEHYTPNLIHGSPEQVVEQLQPYVEAGVEEIVLQWGVDHVEGVHQLAEEVLPHVQG